MIRFLFANGGESDESGIKPWWRLAGNVRGHQHGMHKPREQGGCNQGGENNSECSFHGFAPLSKTDEFPYWNVPLLSNLSIPFRGAD